LKNNQMVYVDDFYKTGVKYGRMKMCHMIADTREELLAMARRIQVDDKWIQYANTPREHFDICLSKRKLAIQHGAIEINMRELAQKVQERGVCFPVKNPTNPL